MRKANIFILSYIVRKDSSEEDVLGEDLGISFPCMLLRERNNPNVLL